MRKEFGKLFMLDFISTIVYNDGDFTRIKQLKNGKRSSADVKVYDKYKIWLEIHWERL